MNDPNVLKGRAWVCGDYTDCYQILPQQYWFSGDKVGSLDKTELSRHVMEELDPLFLQDAANGKYQFIVGGKNFGGGGKSIEHPIIAIKGLNIKAVIADSISRYFYRNAINNGLIVIAAEGISQDVHNGHELRVDIDSGEVTLYGPAGPRDGCFYVVNSKVLIKGDDKKTYEIGKDRLIPSNIDLTHKEPSRMFFHDIVVADEVLEKLP